MCGTESAATNNVCGDYQVEGTRELSDELKVDLTPTRNPFVNQTPKIQGCYEHFKWWIVFWIMMPIKVVHLRHPVRLTMLFPVDPHPPHGAAPHIEPWLGHFVPT